MFKFIWEAIVSWATMIYELVMIPLRWIANFVVEKIIGPIHWNTKHEITPEQASEIQERLTDDYYLILTQRSSHLSSWFINLGHWLLTFRWGYYTHILMNLEDEVQSPDDFRLIEAVGTGTKYSTLEEVLVDVDSIALLKPVHMTMDDWTAAMDRARKYLYTPYDTLFDLKTDTKISCVELVRLAMQAVPDYDIKFSNFEKMITEERNLTPQMFLECPDFEVVYEIRNR